MPTAKIRRRRSLVTRFVLGLMALFVLFLVVAVAGGLIAQSRIDPIALRQRIERQCFEATGRTLTLGSAELRFLPVPTLTLTDLALSGLPTDSRPHMLNAATVSAHLALWPLLHHVARLDGVSVENADLLLQRDAEGHANWRFAPPDREVGPGSTPSGGERWRVEIGSVRVRDSAVAWQDAQGGWTGHAAVDRLDGSDLAGSSPEITLSGRHDQAAFDARLRTGILSRLSAPADGNAPWPIAVNVQTSRNGRPDVFLVLNGSLTDPARLRGYRAEVKLDARRAEGLRALFPKSGIPPLGPIALTARIEDEAPEAAPSAVPAVRMLALRGEQLDLGSLIHRGWSQGLVLRHLDVNAPTRNAPVSISAEGVWRDRPMQVRSTAGTLDGWRSLFKGAAAAQPSEPAPFDLALSAGGATASVQGTGDQKGVHAAIKGSAPTLRSLLPVGPALTGVALTATVAAGPDRHIVIGDLDLRSDQASLAGAATIDAVAHPKVDATLKSSHLDLDALRADWVDPGLPPARPTENPAAVPASRAPGPSGDATPTSQAAQADEHPIPFDRLDCCDVKLDLHAEKVTFDRTAFSKMAVSFDLEDGKLDLQTLSAEGPVGPIALAGQADAAERSLAIKLAPSMLPAPLLAGWLGREPVLDGAVELVGDLRSAGGSWEGLIRGATGHLGLSMVNGSIATSALGQIIGRPQAAAAGIDPKGKDGRTGFRCLALPAVLNDGSATLDPIGLSTSRLAIGGRGTIALADGRLDLHLLPRLTMGATGASLPVRIGGTIDAPEAALDPAAPGGRYSLQIGGPAEADPCPADLAKARFGAPGPAASAVPEEGRHKAPKPIDILRGLGLFH